MPITQHRWLEAIFSPEEAEELKRTEFKEFLRSASWYRTFKNELSIYGIRNGVLEEFIARQGEDLKVDRDDLKKNLRRFREAFYYETHLRKAGKESC